jgi:hypothetical protein
LPDYGDRSVVSANLLATENDNRKRQPYWALPSVRGVRGRRSGSADGFLQTG